MSGGAVDQLWFFLKLWIFYDLCLKLWINSQLNLKAFLCGCCDVFNQNILVLQSTKIKSQALISIVRMDPWSLCCCCVSLLCPQAIYRSSITPHHVTLSFSSQFQAFRFSKNDLTVIRRQGGIRQDGDAILQPVVQHNNLVCSIYITSISIWA